MSAFHPLLTLVSPERIRVWADQGAADGQTYRRPAQGAPTEHEKFVERNDPETCLERAHADRAKAAAATTENQRRQFELSAARWLARAKLLSR